MVDPPYPLEYGTGPRLLIRSTLNSQEGTGMLYTVRDIFSVENGILFTFTQFPTF